MSVRTAIRRLRAYEAGKPIPNGDTIRIPVANDADLMTLAFVRMGGESRPWAVGWTHPAGTPTVLTVPDGRNRDDVGRMVAEFAPAFLSHVRHPDFDDGEFDEDGPALFRQIWVPNRTHMTMLHYLAFTYERVTADQARVPIAQRELLETLARSAGWAFNESQRPGNVSIVDATAALQESFTFPADDLRQQHLGFLLGWLQTKGRAKARAAAAAAAERESISTSLDPALENDRLEDLVERRTAVRSERARARVEREIAVTLERELLHRLELTRAAIEVLCADARPSNPGLDRLLELSDDERENRLVYPESTNPDGSRRFRPRVETDHSPAAAAANYFNQQYCADVQVDALVHYDSELQAEARAVGDAIFGTIVEVEEFIPPGARKKRARWFIEAEHLGPLRLASGSEVCVAGVPKRAGVITELERDDNNVDLVVEVNKMAEAPEGNAQGLLAAFDPALEGALVTLLPVVNPFFAKTKRARIWRRDGPGGWLTHRSGDEPRSGRRGRRAPADPVAAVERIRARRNAR